MTLAQAGSLTPEGPVARVMADLWWLMLWLGTAVFVLYVVLLVVALRRRARAEEPAPPDTGTAGHGRWLVLGGTVMPAVIILVVFGASLQAMRVIPSEAPDDALTVEVTAHQWWYEVAYPDLGVTTANEFHIPTGRPVAFQLTSADVIHSFWVPELGGKIDMLPEDENTLVLEADRPGEYRGSCAEFCGLQHARMEILVVAHAPEDFDAWVEDQRRPAADPADATAARGRDVLLGSGCANCHTVRGTDAAGTTGPELTHLASRRTLLTGTRPNTREHLAAVVTRPQEVKPGIHMSPTDLGPGELEALLAYLQGLR